MAIYRALRDLGIGDKVIPAGELFHSARLKPETLAILETAQKIAPASLPPLAAMPGWKTKQPKLAKIGVITAGDFLEADDIALAGALKLPEAEIRQAKAEMYAQFATPKPKG